MSTITARRRSLKEATMTGAIIVDFLPDSRRNVIIHCEDYSCLAYLDELGIWRHGPDNKPIEGRVMGWVPLGK
jgi:hypothetical protein